MRSVLLKLLVIGSLKLLFFGLSGTKLAPDGTERNTLHGSEDRIDDSCEFIPPLIPGVVILKLSCPPKIL